MDICCILMAAGSASRFGENKLLRPFRGTPLYLRALRAIPPDLFSSVVVVTGCEAIARSARELGFAVVINDRPAEGVSRTIRLGLAQAGHCDGALFMTADQPLLTAQTLVRLAEAFQKQPASIMAAGCGEKRGNPCLFPKDLFPELLALTGDVGGSRVIRANASRLTLVQTAEAELADCDTPEAFTALEQGDFCEKTEEKP